MEITYVNQKLFTFACASKLFGKTSIIWVCSITYKNVRIGLSINELTQKLRRLNDLLKSSLLVLALEGRLTKHHFI